MRVYVSNGFCHGALARTFIDALIEKGIQVEHSPRPNAIPKLWYDHLCDETIAKAQIFVAVVDLDGTGSTWMAIEADAAYKLAQAHVALGLQTLQTYFWNPQQLRIPIGMQAYAANELPKSLPQAIAHLRSLAERANKLTPLIPSTTKCAH